MEWTLEKIRARVRKLTGRPSTNQLSASDLDNYINDYYQNLFPSQVSLQDNANWFEISTVAGTGEYALDDDVVEINFPILVDNEQIVLVHDPDYFFKLFPRDQETSDYYDTPTHLLLMGRTVYLRPIPDDVYTVKPLNKERPTELTADDDQPIDQKWGPAIACGAASQILIDNGDFETAETIAKLLEFHLKTILGTAARGKAGARSVPRF